MGFQGRFNCCMSRISFSLLYSNKHAHIISPPLSLRIPLTLCMCVRLSVSLFITSFYTQSYLSMVQNYAMCTYMPSNVYSPKKGKGGGVEVKRTVGCFVLVQFLSLSLSLSASLSRSFCISFRYFSQRHSSFFPSLTLFLPHPFQSTPHPTKKSHFHLLLHRWFLRSRTSLPTRNTSLLSNTISYYPKQLIL